MQFNLAKFRCNWDFLLFAQHRGKKREKFCSNIMFDLHKTNRHHKLECIFETIQIAVSEIIKLFIVKYDTILILSFVLYVQLRLHGLSCYAETVSIPFTLFKYHFRQITQFFTLCTLINGQTLLCPFPLLFYLLASPLLMLAKLLAIFHVFHTHAHAEWNFRSLFAVCFIERLIYKCFIFKEGNNLEDCELAAPAVMGLETWGLCV